MVAFAANARRLEPYDEALLAQIAEICWVPLAVDRSGGSEQPVSRWVDGGFDPERDSWLRDPDEENS